MCLDKGIKKGQGSQTIILILLRNQRTLLIQFYRCSIATGCNIMLRFSFIHGAKASSEPGPPHYRSFTIILRHTTLCMSSPNKWSDRRRELYLTHAQHSQENINAPGGIQTHHPSKWATADPRLRSFGQWDRHFLIYTYSDFTAKF